MIANTGKPPRLLLRTSEFDQAADELFGEDTYDYRVAEHLGVGPAVLSLYRNGHRQPPADFIATVLATFPGATFDRFFYRVDAEAHAERGAA